MRTSATWATGSSARPPRPATDREVADAQREERAGDDAFAKADPKSALRRYRRAVDAAPDRGDAYYRVAFAELALGNFAGAGEDLRRALELNPSLPTTGPSLRELYGGGNALARTALLSSVAAYTREDVRDPDRLFLLAAAMHAAGDSRSREIFEAAWRLTGGRPHLRAYLDPVSVQFDPPAADAATDAAGDPLDAPVPVEIGPADDDFDKSGESDDAA